MSNYSTKTRMKHGNELLLYQPDNLSQHGPTINNSDTYEELYSRSSSGPPYIQPNDFHHIVVKKEVAQWVFERTTHKVNGTSVKRSNRATIVPVGAYTPRAANQARPYVYYQANLPRPSLFSDAVMQAYGLKGVNRMSPLRPKASVAQTIVELKTQLPKLSSDLYKRIKGSGATLTRKKRTKGSAKAGSQDYLNFQFGIMPLVRDAIDILQAAIAAERAYERFVRLNGKWVSRKVTLERSSDTVTTSSNTLAGIGAQMISQGTQSEFLIIDNSRGPSFERRVTTDVHVYATCQYRYYFPELPKSGFDRTLHEIQRLGGNITPALLWELMPWSFLLDWFVNIGDLIEFWQNKGNDSLLYRNLAVMATKTITTTHTGTFIGYLDVWDPIPGKGSPYPPNTKRGSCSSTSTVTTKQRYVGSTFGFGTDPGSLSGFQVSILAALGLSRTGSKF